MTDPLPAGMLDELVAANHILYQHGVVDGFGHVSVRDPRDASRFWMSRSMAPGLVTAEDVLPFDLDCNPLIPDAPPVYAERFIHGEIYRVRPEVMSVVHSHAPSLIPFGAVSDVPLMPLYHMSSFLGTGAPIFEIRDHAGQSSDLLIREPALGEALAKTLGDSAVILMRGHGATVVGTEIRQAVFRAIYAAESAALQAQALRLGPVTYLTAGEAENAARANDIHMGRAWDLWMRDVANTGGCGCGEKG